MAVDYSKLLDMIPTIGLWGMRAILGAVGIGIVYAFAFYVNRIKRYNWVVRIFDKDANGQIIQQKDDKGGIFIDRKTNYRLFLLRRTKFGLDPDEIPYILTSKGQKIVYILQTGLKNFQYMVPKIVNDSQIVFNVQDEDVAWAMNAWERYKNPYKNKFLEHIMPFIGMAFVFLLVIISLYYIFKHIGVLSEVANAFKDAATEFAKVQTGTEVIGG